MTTGLVSGVGGLLLRDETKDRIKLVNVVQEMSFIYGRAPTSTSFNVDG